MSTPRTLAALLRSWPVDQLTGLLEARPDLAVPAPGDSAQLAARATTRTSLLRALEELNTCELAVLEAVASAGPLTEPELAAVVAADSVPRVLDVLRARLLVWDDGSGLRAPTQLVELIGVPPGPRAHEVDGLLSELDAAARTMLDHLAATGADGRLDSVPTRLSTATARTPAEQLLARGLLAARDAHRVTVPWSVRLRLHGGRSTRDAVDRVPALDLTAVDEALADRASAGAAFEAVRRTEVLLDQWGARPPAVLRSGGVGVRDLRLAAAHLQVDEREAALLVETAAAAGLLATGATEDLDAAWLPTDDYDAWLSSTAAERWLRLVLAWLDSPRRPATVGGREAGKPVNALADGLERAWLPGLRREVLRELLAAGGGQALAADTGRTTLLQRLRWRRPRRSAPWEPAVAEVLDEARMLGLTGREALAQHGRALLGGQEVAPVLDALLPEPVDHVLVQADLTAVAPGPLEPELARDLGLLAEVESRGSATVYRFTADSVRRALDVGWSAAEVHDFVAAASRTPVPQALSYLIDDVVRRFGVLRAGQVECFLRSDDETALTALLHDPAATSLRLRRIAPTVLVSDVPLDTLLPRLRELGRAPVVEGPDGTVHVARPEVHRARPRHRPRTHAATRARMLARDTTRASAVAAAVRAGDRAAAARPSRAQATSPADVVSLLRAAVESGDPVLLGYVGSDGTVTERLVRPRRVEGGRLTAHDERSDDDREFALHRITAAAPR